MWEENLGQFSDSCQLSKNRQIFISVGNAELEVLKARGQNVHMVQQSAVVPEQSGASSERHYFNLSW